MSDFLSLPKESNRKTHAQFHPRLGVWGEAAGQEGGWGAGGLPGAGQRLWPPALSLWSGPVPCHRMITSIRIWKCNCSITRVFWSPPSSLGGVLQLNGIMLSRLTRSSFPRPGLCSVSGSGASSGIRFCHHNKGGNPIGRRVTWAGPSVSPNLVTQGYCNEKVGQILLV